MSSPPDTSATATSESTRRVLYCHCAFARVVPKDVKEGVLQGLSDSGIAFEAVPDLCELAARRDPSLERLAGGDAPLEIVACYPRAVRWLFHAAKTPLPEDGVKFHNMRTQDAEATLQAVLNPTSTSSSETPAAAVDSESLETAVMENAS